MKVVIIGKGITGVTAAFELRARQPDWEITMVSGETDSYYSRPALMYIWLGHMSLKDTRPYEDHVWGRQRIRRVEAWVGGVDTDRRQVKLAGGGTLAYDRLLIATGSKPNRFGWPGQDLDGVQGFYDLQDLQRLEENTAGVDRAVIVGGGLIGVELAEMLHARGIAVTILAREQSYWDNVMPKAESSIINEVIRENGIDLRLETELQEIVGDDHGRTCAVVTGSGERIDCGMVGLTAGVSNICPTSFAVKRFPNKIVAWNGRVPGKRSKQDSNASITTI